MSYSEVDDIDLARQGMDITEQVGIQFAEMDKQIAREKNTCLKCCMINHKWCLMSMVIIGFFLIYCGGTIGTYLSKTPLQLELIIQGLNATHKFFTNNDLRHAV